MVSARSEVSEVTANMFSNAGMLGGYHRADLIMSKGRGYERVYGARQRSMHADVTLSKHAVPFCEIPAYLASPGIFKDGSLNLSPQRCSFG